MPISQARSFHRRLMTILGVTTSVTTLLLAGQTTDLTLSRSRLADKIKGGWAGQVIGCTVGGPSEHRFSSSLVPDSYKIFWSPDQLASQLKSSPEIYDAHYVDMAFLEAIEKKG